MGESVFRLIQRCGVNSQIGITAQGVRERAMNPLGINARDLGISSLVDEFIPDGDAKQIHRCAIKLARTPVAQTKKIPARWSAGIQIRCRWKLLRALFDPRADQPHLIVRQRRNLGLVIFRRHPVIFIDEVRN
jgi:hypothetical protein